MKKRTREEFEQSMTEQKTIERGYKKLRANDNS